ncbi:hypothetical protein F4859DRAFT_323907 [Xylaria cf. heliscus]|nr:hypothetical protein F4859DRAFT_323907 [Xylaria cf. heliscus]
MMYPLGHQEPVGARTQVLGNNNGDLKTGLDQRRKASSRLSCISEHQKENTPNSEDDYFFPSTQVMKTPSLEPVRHPHFHRHVDGKSRSSGDGSEVSPLQLESEQMDGCWRQRTRNQLILSTWRCATSGEDKEEIEQLDPPYAKPPGQGSSEHLEVRWQTIRCTEARRKIICTKECRRSIPGTGFDGPRSSTSGETPLDSPSNTSRPPLGALALGNCMPCTSRSSKSNTSGSIDWERSWPKRKPQRGHDVSESSDREQTSPRHPVDASTTEAEDISKTAPLKHEKIDQPRYSNVQDSDLKSCPEFDQQSSSAVTPTTSRFSPDKVPRLESPDYSQFDSSRHQHRHHFSSTVSKRFRSLRDRLQRSRSSSMFSVRPEFPPPPDGKERRYRSRNSNDIWPSSGEESPIFNTPASNMSPVPPAGHNANLLAASGLMMAAADIDRLTESAYKSNRPRMPGTRSLELPRPRLPSSGDSPPSENGLSGVNTTPIVPANSPSSLSPPAGLTNPISRSPQWPGRVTRRQPSRLSEVTTPDEVNNPPQLSDDIVARPHVFWSTGDMHDICKLAEVEREDSPLPRHLSNSRPSSSDDKPNSENSLASISEMTHFPRTYIDRSGLGLGRDDTASERSSLRGKTLEQDRKRNNSSDEGDVRECISDPMPSTIRPRIITSKSEPNCEQSLKEELERMDMVAQESALFADVMERLNSGEHDSTTAERGSNSCHLDTWSEDQGEPGDSEPFCPPACLYSKRCGHESEP